MRRAVRRWPERAWAVEGCQGIGRHIARRLIADGEHVADVPPKLSARTRVFATGQGRKTGATDAHSVALAATRMTGLRPVIDDEQLAVLRIMADRRRSLGEDHTRMISQLHQLLLELIPGGGEEGSVRGPGEGAPGRGPAAGPCRAGPAAGGRGAGQRPGAHLPAQESRRQGTTGPAEGHRHHPDQPQRDRSLRRRPRSWSKPATQPGSRTRRISRPGTAPRRSTRPPATRSAIGRRGRGTGSSSVGFPWRGFRSKGLWGFVGPPRYGLAPRTLSQAREAEAEVLANWHLWLTESARAASIAPGQESSRKASKCRASVPRASADRRLGASFRG